MYDNRPPTRRQQNNRPASNMLGVLSLLESGAHVIPLCWSDAPGSLTCSCPHGHKEKRGEVNAQGVREDVRWKQVGKVPLVDWQAYQNEPPDEDQVMDWWVRWPRANAAVLLEPSKLLVVDIDSHAAEQEVRALGIEGGAQVVRGGKLKHLYYRRPEGVDITRRTRVGESGRIDILPSGYVVAPPSVHGSGLAYEWGAVALGDVDDLPLPPAWVLEMLRSASESEDIDVFSGDLSGVVEGFAPQSKQEERIASALSTLSPHCKRDAWIKIGAMLVGGFAWGEGDEHVANLQRGFALWASWSQGPEDNPYLDFDVESAARDWSNLVKRRKQRQKRVDMLREFAREEGRDLTEDERKMGPATVASLFHAAHQSPHGWTDPHPPYGIIEECKEVGSAWVSDADIAVEPERMNVIPMTRASAKPKPQPLDEPEHLRMMPPEVPHGGGGGNGGNGGGGGITKYPNPIYAYSDMEFAELVARFVQGDSPAPIVYDEGSVWRYRGEESRWAPVSEDAIRHATRWLDGCPVAFVGENGETQTKPKRLSYSALSSISRSVPVVTLCEEFFAEAPRGAQFRNAFVQVRRDGSLHVQPPGPEHRQRLGVPMDYNPAARCDLWEKSLMDWLTPKASDDDDPNPINPIEACHELMDFLQEFVGVTLMGWAPKFQMMVVLLGEGSNGKSVFMDVVASLFPEEVTSNTPPQDFTGPQMQNAVANMAGKRLCYFADIPANELVNSSKLKALISGDKIEGRAVYEKTKRFRPEAGFLYSANELPASRDNSHGFWRRAAAVMFGNTFSPEDEGFDSDLTAKLMAEREGIYRWAVEGAQRALERGKFDLPVLCRQQMDTWRRESNPLERWAEECVERPEKPEASNSHHWSTSGYLYPSYAEWCKRNGHHATSSTKFARGLGRVLGESQRKRNYDRGAPGKPKRCYLGSLTSTERAHFGYV